MEELRQIYNSLTSSEKRFVRNYYKNDPDKKRLRLFQLLDEGIEISDDEAMKEIYGNISKTAFSHLKSRLKKDIMSVLLFQEGDKQHAAPYRQAEIDCRRYLIEGDLLLKRGVYNTAIKTLNKALKLAEQYELGPEAILLQDTLRSHLGFKKGPSIYNYYTEKIHDQLQILQAILEARELYNNILLPNMFRTNQDADYVELARDSFQKLKQSYENYQSPTVGYYYFLTAYYYFEFINDFESALHYVEKLLTLTLNSPSVKSPARIANANLQLSHLLIKTGRYQNAIDYALEAMEHFKSGLMNELIANEVLFFAQFRAGYLEEAGSTVQTAMAHPKLKSSDYIHAKWWFYKAAFHFAKGEYDDSIAALHEDTTLTNDKTGWLFGYKLLEIMNYIEQEQYYLIDFRVEALRKLLQRQKKKSTKRVKMIFNVLNTYTQRDYDFQETIEKEANQLRQLQEAKGDFEWNPMGYEIIRFDDWLLSKSSITEG